MIHTFQTMKVVGLFLCHFSAALFFEMSEKETKCFIEELPEETMVVGKYKTELIDEKANTKSKSKPGLGMHVEVKDPNNKVSRFYRISTVYFKTPTSRSNCSPLQVTTFFKGSLQYP